MVSHTASTLRGPISRNRGWWQTTPREVRPIRQELIDRIRKEIEAGTYDTPEKLDAALKNFLKRHR